MAWFTRKRETSERKAWREQFEGTISALRETDEASQVAVGHSINMANSILIKRFGSIDAFRQLPKSSKLEYINKLSQVKDDLSERDPHAALGFVLYGMWLGAVTESDDELAHKFSSELAYFSRKGDMGG
jgi:hypothetical protein